MYKHIIPQNISDNGDFFNGAIKKRNFYEGVAIFVVGIIILKFGLFAVPLIYRSIIFVFFPCLITVFALIGIGDQSLFECIGTLISYRTMKDILPYALYTDKDSLSEESKEAKMKEKKEKRLRKKTSRTRKKDDESGSQNKSKSAKSEKKNREKKLKKISNAETDLLDEFL